MSAVAGKALPARSLSRPLLLAVGGYLLLYLSWQAFRWIPLRNELTETVFVLGINAAAILLVLRARARSRFQPRLASAWGWIALALTGQFLGGVAQFVYEYLLHKLAYPTLADLLFLSFYPLMLVGILRLPALPSRGRAAIELVLDCAIVGLGGGAVFVYLILGPSALAASSTLETAASVAYPIGDMILLVGLAGVLLRGARADTRAGLGLIAGALALFIVGDLSYGYIVLHGVYHGGDPIDIAYILAFGCFTLAGAAQRPVTADPPILPEAGPGPRLSWVPYLAILACGAVLVAKEIDQPLFPDLSIALIVVLVTALVVIRQLLAQLSVNQSYASLAQALALAQMGFSESRHMETRLRYHSNHDSLTGLFNRHRFAEEFDRVLRGARRYHRSGALLILDVDNFKLINDTSGHAVGDSTLEAFARAVAQRTRATDIVARLGGDELAIVLPEVNQRQALAVADAVRSGLKVAGVDRPIHVSVGIAMFDGEDDLHVDDVLIAADTALYEAKEDGRDQVRVYHGSTSASLSWAQRVRGALAEERFVLYAQPIVDLRTGRTAYRELLIRMLSDSGEVIPPGAFLPTAERLGLINDIDRWVLREGLALARGGERVSINLSAHSIGDEQILAELRRALRAGLDPASVIFEITETAAMTNMADARAFVQALADTGCDVALDDFGTGFGSFSYLKHLPARYLKIDMEFVRDIVTNSTDQQVVSAITGVAHSLGKLTIAEGVEDAAILETLRGYGVDYAQGFHVGCPARISPPKRCERRAGVGGAQRKAGARPQQLRA